MMMLNIYMAYSRGAGSEECATLVFAHSVQEARVVAWHGTGSDITNDYLDLAATRLRGVEWLREEADGLKYANDQAHEIDNPHSCSVCEKWGHSPIGIDGLCEDCRHEAILATY
jgi:hypothetical protein